MTSEIIMEKALSSIVAIFAIVANVIIAKINTDKNQRLKDKIKYLTEHPLTHKEGIYYDETGWPFCPVCRKPLQHIGNPGQGHTHSCPKCHNCFSPNRLSPS